MPDRFPTGYQMEPGGPYNWSADSSQQRALLAAKNWGADTFESVSFSPPWWMTLSKDVAGNYKGSYNLPEENYGAFGDYLATVINYFATDVGVKFGVLAPFNEPLHRWWYQGNGQEGNQFRREQLVPCLRAVRQALDNKGLTDVRLTMIDDWPDQTMEFLDSMAGNEEEMGMVARIDVHGYRSRTHIDEGNFSPTYYSNVKNVSGERGGGREGEWE